MRCEETPDLAAKLGNIPQPRRPWIVGLTLAVMLAPSAAFAALPPVVDGFTASPAVVAPGEVTHLTVTAHDPDCPDTCTSGCGLRVRADLTRWLADGGTFVTQDNGTSGSPYSASADWQAPAEEGTYTLTVELSDSGSFFCGGRQTTTADLTVLVTTSSNQPPGIDSLTASRVQMLPGASSQLECLASDPDGDAVTYSWQSDAGSVTPGGEGEALFEAGAPGIATVTCVATDTGGASGQATVQLSVTGALVEKALDSDLATPQRLAVDALGDVYVADRRSGGITVLHLASGELIYRLPVPEVSSVAVDWRGDLLVGDRRGARVLDRRGAVLRVLDPGALLGDVSDVAVDSARQRWGVLYRTARRVVVFDETGTVAVEFGSPEDFMSPQGLAATPAGDWVVSDPGTGQVRIYGPDGALLTTFGERGAGAGEFVQLDDVVVDGEGLIYASDSFQDWVQVFHPDGSLREVLGTYGEELGTFQTATGLAVSGSFGRLLAASLNTSSVQVFRTREDGQEPPLPRALLSTFQLAFDRQAVDTTGAPRQVVLTNGGGTLLGVRGVTVTGDFAQSNDCAVFLDPGAACTFSVTSTPATVGPRDGVLALDTSAGRLEVRLLGSGFLPPGVLFSPVRLDFPDQELGTTSLPKAVLLTNTGTDPLLISAIGVTGGDYSQSNDCGATLPSGALCLIRVDFTPSTVADEIPGALVVYSNASGAPHAVLLEGRGVPGEILVTIADATVSEGDEPARVELPVTLSSPSAVPVTVEYVTRAGSATPGEDFEAVAGTLELAPGETAVTVTVPIVDDGVLEPDEETFEVELTSASRATLERALAVATIVDDELCPGPDLLRNPGAEERSVTAVLPGWSVPGDWQRRTEPEPFDGLAYFAGTSGEIFQDVDAAAYAAAIAGGEQNFVLEGWVRTAPGGRARASIELRDLDNAAVLEVFDSGTLSGTATWQPVVVVATAPAGSGFLRVRLAAEGGADFDALALRSLRAAALRIDDLAVYEGDVGSAVAELAVRLSCPYYRPLALDFATSDGGEGLPAATAGEDYLATAGSLALEAGETAAPIAVEILGDELDEPHEAFSVDLALEDDGDDATVLVDGRALGVIVNDDFCARGAGYWKNRPDLWPVEYLVLGGVEYDPPALATLLAYGGPDAAAKLARQLVATLLNLETGSEPSIWPVVDEADAFLAAWPPGSSPAGEERREAQRLKALLEDYNQAPCPEDD